MTKQNKRQKNSAIGTARALSRPAGKSMISAARNLSSSDETMISVARKISKKGKAPVVLGSAAGKTISPKGAGKAPSRRTTTTRGPKKPASTKGGFLAEQEARIAELKGMIGPEFLTGFRYRVKEPSKVIILVKTTKPKWHKIARELRAKIVDGRAEITFAVNIKKIRDKIANSGIPDSKIIESTAIQAYIEALEKLAGRIGARTKGSASKKSRTLYSHGYVIRDHEALIIVNRDFYDDAGYSNEQYERTAKSLYPGINFIVDIITDLGKSRIISPEVGLEDDGTFDDDDIVKRREKEGVARSRRLSTRRPPASHPPIEGLAKRMYDLYKSEADAVRKIITIDVDKRPWKAREGDIVARNATVELITERLPYKPERTMILKNVTIIDEGEPNYHLWVLKPKGDRQRTVYKGSVKMINGYHINYERGW